MKDQEQWAGVYQAIVTDTKAGYPLEFRLVKADSLEEAERIENGGLHGGITVDFIDSERVRSLIGIDRFRVLFEEICATAIYPYDEPIFYILRTPKEKAEFEAEVREMVAKDELQTKS